MRIQHAVEVAQAYIKEQQINDDDLQQQIYLYALECANVCTSPVELYRLIYEMDTELRIKCKDNSYNYDFKSCCNCCGCDEDCYDEDSDDDNEDDDDCLDDIVDYIRSMTNINNAIKNAIMALDHYEQEVIANKFFKQMTSSEIAAISRKPVIYVVNTEKTALDKMRHDSDLNKYFHVFFN